MLPDKIKDRIEQLASVVKPQGKHFNMLSLDEKAVILQEQCATDIATELYEHIKELRGALKSAKEFETIYQYPEHEIRHALAVELPYGIEQALQSSIEKWGDDKESK